MKTEDINEMLFLLKEALRLADEDISNYRNHKFSTQFYNLTVDSKWYSRTKDIIERWTPQEENLSKQQLD